MPRTRSKSISARRRRRASHAALLLSSVHSSRPLKVRSSRPPTIERILSVAPQWVLRPIPEGMGVERAGAPRRASNGYNQQRSDEERRALRAARHSGSSFGSLSPEPAASNLPAPLAGVPLPLRERPGAPCGLRCAGIDFRGIDRERTSPIRAQSGRHIRTSGVGRASSAHRENPCINVIESCSALIPRPRSLWPR
jgi:hypothetical protein